jgi:ABC-type antimicrobial peptide transport system permease subunit
VGGFALAALLISAIGLYGLISYQVTQRAREFGIRMALGAESSDVRRMVLADGLRLTAVGAAIGTIAALGGLRFMRGLLYGVSAGDPITLASVVVLICAIAVVAAYVPARRATLVHPVRSLQEQ